MARLFFGIDIPMDIRRQLVGLSEPIQGARWQREDQLHMTLSFLGDLSVEEVEGLCHCFRGLSFPAFSLSVKGVASFGPEGRPRTLWAGLDPEMPLRKLHGRVGAMLIELNIPVRRSKFKPHITLARMRRESEPVAGFLERHQGLESRSFRVNELVLFESDRRPSGSRYSVVERFPLTDDNSAD